jgi:hypothetical protein
MRERAACYTAGTVFKAFLREREEVPMIAGVRFPSASSRSLDFPSASRFVPPFPVPRRVNDMPPFSRSPVLQLGRL